MIILKHKQFSLIIQNRRLIVSTVSSNSQNEEQIIITKIPAVDIECNKDKKRPKKWKHSIL